MTRRTYTPEYKSKLVIEVLQGERHQPQYAAELEGRVSGERRPRL